jgi:hypothetical protein
MTQQYHSIPGWTQLNLLQRYLYPYVPCNIIYHNKAVEKAKMPPTNEWIKKIWYLYTMEFYSATKNEIFSFAT